MRIAMATGMQADQLAPIGRDELGGDLEDRGPKAFEHRSPGSARADARDAGHSLDDPATRTYAIRAIAAPRKISIVVPA